jgi:ElaB/YqjD/DUF883 family membrane-anchored ribosome-binding protein
MESRLATPTNESRSLSAEHLVEDFRSIIQRAEQRAAERARAADKVVRAHPYQAIGVAAGLGLLIGVLAGRKWTS